MTPDEQKAALRRQLRLLLSEISPEQRAEASRRAGSLLLASPAWAESGCVMGFMSLPTEICTEAVLRAALAEGKRMVLPKADWAERRIIAVEVRSLETDLVDGRFGLREPRLAGATPVDLGDVDLVLAPGLAFDNAGRRLGRGGGYYDRFLVELSPRTVRCGLAYECQRFSAPLPAAEHDIMVDLLVTEAGVYEFRQRGRRGGGSEEGRA